jgi:indole-3-glycerol phosphate synthase
MEPSTTHRSSQSFLERIRPEKEARVAELLAGDEIDLSNAPPVRSLYKALTVSGLSAIAEVKRASPSQGVIHPDACAKTIALSYESAGAAAISVLTDERWFGGTLADLTAVRAAVEIPVLKKDFHIDPIQLRAGRAAGADAVLLMVAMLPGDSLQLMLDATHDLGMEAIVEVHTHDELQAALKTNAKIIGVNNRDLTTLKIDLAHGESMLPLIPSGIATIGESGISTHSDRDRMVMAGADAILVGTSLMRTDNPGGALLEMLSCG